jgi:nucleoside-diphosphate kinase
VSISPQLLKNQPILTRTLPTLFKKEPEKARLPCLFSTFQYDYLRFFPILGYIEKLFHRQEELTLELTLSIIKPDGVERNLVGKIISKFEDQGIRIAAIKKVQLSRAQAEAFYAVHKARPFFGELVEFMTRSPVVIMALQGENVIVRNRDIMGATNPAQAAAGTIRKDFAKSIGENTVHGSDSPEAAKNEVAFFFASSEIC